MPVLSRDMNGAMSAAAAADSETEVGASGSAAASSTATELIAEPSVLGCGEKLNTGRGGGGGGAKRDASAAAWSANIGAGGGTSPAKGFAKVIGVVLDDGVAVGLVLPLLLLESREDDEARRWVLELALLASVGEARDGLEVLHEWGAAAWCLD